MRENYKDSKDNKENKDSSKRAILLAFKIVLILLLYYCNYKYTNKKEKLRSNIHIILLIYINLKKQLI